MANNHVLDYGQVGLADTLAAIKASGQPVVGIGATSTEAYAPWITEVRGTRIAFLGLSQIRELAPTWTARPHRPGMASALDVAAATAAVRKARTQADAVVVFLHWGKEQYACPTPAMKTLAKALSDAGADAIISSHAHLMLGDGYLGRTYVQYGLGNFLWWLNTPVSDDTGVLTVTMRGRQVTKAELVPARVSRTGQPVLATGAEATRIRTKYAGLRACTGLHAAPR
jgi:poly-gamma-glutamate synthesis protein (capsule biosynthesis protein)